MDALNEVYLPDPFEVLGALINILLYPLTLPFRVMPQLPAPTMSQMQIPQPGNNVKDSAPKTTYQNAEEWELKRDENGRLEAIVIHRKATTSGEK